MTLLSEKSAVVTGASSGIGRAIVNSLIGSGWHVFGSVRKEADAEDLVSACGESVTPLLFDVTSTDSIAEAARHVDEALEGRTLCGLVNNAGIAVGGPLIHIDPDEVRRQFEVNIMGPIQVTQAFAPLLGTDRNRRGKPGRIVNMSSVGGKIASPLLGPYAMSKHALEAFTRSLRRELLMYRIDVVSVGPGAVKTPIWQKAQEIDPSIYKDTDYFSALSDMQAMFKDANEKGLEPSAIGNLVTMILNADKPKPRYAILRDKLLFWTLPRLIPERMLDKIVVDRTGLKGSGS